VDVRKQEEKLAWTIKLSSALWSPPEVKDQCPGNKPDFVPISGCKKLKVGPKLRQFLRIPFRCEFYSLIISYYTIFYFSYFRFIVCFIYYVLYFLFSSFSSLFSPFSYFPSLISPFIHSFLPLCLPPFL
jgi:hypothetical protein